MAHKYGISLRFMDMLKHKIHITQYLCIYGLCIIQTLFFFMLKLAFFSAVFNL